MKASLRCAAETQLGSPSNQNAVCQDCALLRDCYCSLVTSYTDALLKVRSDGRVFAVSRSGLLEQLRMKTQQARRQWEKHERSHRCSASLPNDRTSQDQTQPSPVVRIPVNPRCSEKDLTVRQTEVLQALAAGRTVKDVAARLRMSTRTVEFHKYRIMDILGIHSSVQLGAYAAKHGLVS
jgi:DNA-binding CsgD family transcriptional regulator